MPGFSLSLLLRALLLWSLMMLAESAQGALRRLLLDADTAFALRQAFVVVGAVIVVAITWATLPWLRLRTSRGALLVGGGWAVLTVGFELIVGRLAGQPWASLWPDYDLRRGGLMPLGLLVMALAPWIIRRLQGAGERRSLGDAESG